MSTHNDSNAVEVYAGNLVEAGMVKSLLEDANIKAYLKDEMMGTFSPWWVTPGGTGSVGVVVSSHDLDRAKGIVEEYEKKVREIGTRD